VNTVILVLAIAAVMSIDFLVAFVTLQIGMRAEGSCLSTSSASQARLQGAACRLLGAYVCSEDENVALHYENERR
jgi:hypothetical protein